MVAERCDLIAQLLGRVFLGLGWEELANEALGLWQNLHQPGSDLFRCVQTLGTECQTMKRRWVRPTGPGVAPGGSSGSRKLRHVRIARSTQ